MSTLVIDGHPNADSLCAALARSYLQGNPTATLLAVRELDFEPNLAHGMTRPQHVEPDLVWARDLVERAARIVVVTPTWWASVPPMLKGFLDRVFTPGWAYRYTKLPLGLPGGSPQGLLVGRRGRVLITSDTPAYLLPFMGDHAARTLKNSVLKFCGVKPVTVTRFGGVRWTTLEQRMAWLDRAEQLGRRDAAQPLPAPAAKPVLVASEDLDEVPALEAQNLAGVS